MEQVWASCRPTKKLIREAIKRCTVALEELQWLKAQVGESDNYFYAFYKSEANAKRKYGLKFTTSNLGILEKCGRRYLVS